MSQPNTTSELDNNFLKSWASCETVVDLDTIVCCVCKSTTDLPSISSQKRIIVHKSVVFLVCNRCESVTHLHCSLNCMNIASDLLILTVQSVEKEGHLCINCVQPDSQ